MSEPLTPASRPAQTPAQRQLNTIKAMLDASKSAIASRLPKHLTADRIIKVALTAINKTPKLLACSRESLLLSIMQAAELGLEPSSPLGEGYLVPYGQTCQFIPGYRGLISLARRTGEIANLYAESVYPDDEFIVELGLDPKIIHKPNYESEAREDEHNLTFTYAVARFKDGSYQFTVMSRKQIDKIRRRSKAAENGPWVTDFEQMAIKTPIRRLAKFLPLSVELAKAMELQAAAEGGDFTGLTLDADGVTVEPAPEVPDRTPEVGQGAGQSPASPTVFAQQPSEPQAQAEPSARRSRGDTLKQNLGGSPHAAATPTPSGVNTDDRIRRDPAPAAAGAPLVDPNAPEAELPWPEDEH